MTPMALAPTQAPARPGWRLRRSPLAAKLALAFLGLVAFVLIVNGAIDAWLTYNQAKRAALEVEGEKARAAAERVDAFLTEIETQIGWTTGVEWSFEKPEQQRYDFIRLLRQTPAITSLSYIDGQGKERLAVSRLEPDSIGSDKDFSHDPRFARAVADKVWFGPVEFRRGSEPYMTISLAHAGKTPGVTAADVNLKLAWDVINAIHVGARGFAYVVDDRGRLIAHPDLSLVLRDTDLERLPQVAEALARERAGEASARRFGSAEAAKSLDGASVLTAYAIAPQTHWIVFVEQPLAEALAAAYGSLMRSLALLGLGLALAAVSGVALARRMAAPIRLLQAGAEKLGAGDLAARLNIRTGDEIEALAGSFNRMAESLQDSYETLESKVAARTRDLEQALERQRATAEILKVIAASPSDAAPVFEAVAFTSNRLLGGLSTAVWRFEGELAHLAAFTPTSPEADAALRSMSPMPIGEHTVIAQTNQGEVAQLPDTEEGPPRLRDLARLRGFRAMLFAPLVRGRETLGFVSVTRTAPGAFDPDDMQLLKTFADQAVIAIENARLFNETQEALKQQTATADVLKAISRSVFDPQTVLEALINSAVSLSGSTNGMIFRWEDGAMRARAFAEGEGRADFIAYMQAHPQPPGRGSTVARVALTGEVQNIANLRDDPDISGELRNIVQTRAALGVPMKRGDELIGAIVMSKPEPGAYPERIVELVKTFADQAVIAIENARLFQEVEARTRELEESLAQQTATAEVLKVISSSPSDLKPVLDAIADTAARLCGSEMTMFFRFDGEAFRILASWNFPSDVQAMLEAKAPTPGHPSALGRAGATLRPAYISDVLADPDYGLKTEQNRALYRATLAVPMLREGRLVGALSLNRSEPGSFTQKHIDLVSTFADQAAIAFENARLFEEVRARTRDLEEALAQQTATADVLKVISRSAFGLKTVLQTLVDSAVRLCAQDGVIYLREGDVFRAGAAFGAEIAGRDPRDRSPRRPGRESITGRVALSGRVEQIPDNEADPEFQVAPAQRMNMRARLGVPLLSDGKVEGVFVLAKPDPGLFSDRAVELVRSFADQAVIAIQNVRLFEEVRARTRDLENALERQTATSEILRAIAASPGDADRALQFIAETSARLFAAPSVSIQLAEGAEFVREFRVGAIAQRVGSAYPRSIIKVGGRNLPGTVVAEVRQIHIPDLDNLDPSMADFPGLPHARAGGARTVCGTPLRHDDRAIGALIVFRNLLQPFAADELALLQTFADQAVIAIENARLLAEVQAKTRDLEQSLAQQTATADVLKAISRSAFDLDGVLKTLVGSARELCHASMASISVVSGEFLRFRALVGGGPDFEAFLRANPFPIAAPTRANNAGRVLLAKAASYVEDVASEPDYAFGEASRLGGFRSLLGVPLMREGEVIGVFQIGAPEPAALSQRQIDLVRTFADQAVIAMENARLFGEVQARTRELERSLSDLRKAQDRLVQSEKLASLGQLTAGIAHEIKNPLNFVNNFTTLSRELLEELRETLQRLPDDAKPDAEDLMGMIDSNLEKVASHGKRADSIVKNMLLHSREGSGERARANINAMVEEALNLGYHGARAEKPGFNVTLERDFDPKAGEAELYLQEVTRVLLNLISNGFYASAQRKLSEGPDYAPTLRATTRDLGNSVEIRIRDNGAGIPDDVRAKMFNPFFTTKPAGEGTGLGLSLSHDIVVKQHGGTLDVETAPGAFTEFVVTLPREGAKA